MAFQRPTLSELIDRVQQDLVSRLEISGPILRRSVVHVLARVIAGAAHMLHGHLEYLARQIFPDQSDEEFLLRQAEIFGIRRSAATFAAGEVDATGEDGATVPAGSILLRGDGARYRVLEDATVAGGTALLSVAAELAGADGDVPAGEALTFESPLDGVQAEAVVGPGGIGGGADQEAIESVRERLLDRLRNPPHGGRAADYVAWAREVPGVTRAWVYPQELGVGTVTVRFVRDGDANPIPDAAEVAAVQAYIDVRRPVTAAVTVVAPVPAPLDVAIAITPDTAETRAAVEAELADMLRRIAKPGATIPRSQILLAVGMAAGVEDFLVSSPTTDVPHDVGELPVLGTITWM